MTGAAPPTTPEAVETQSTDYLKSDPEERTVLYCHECSKDFIALLERSIDGNHIIECPWCGHEHCRVIENGRVTGQRWDSRFGSDKTRDAKHPRKVWKSNVIKAESSSASHFIRQRFMDRFYT